MNLRFAYNTNGTANHRLDDAIGLIADAGYAGVALTLDHHHLDPMAAGWQTRTEALARRLRACLDMADSSAWPKRSPPRDPPPMPRPGPARPRPARVCPAVPPPWSSDAAPV